MLDYSLSNQGKQADGLSFPFLKIVITIRNQFQTSKSSFNKVAGAITLSSRSDRRFSSKISRKRIFLSFRHYLVLERRLYSKSLWGNIFCFVLISLRYIVEQTKIDLKNHVFAEALKMHSEANDPQSRISCFDVTLLYIGIGFLSKSSSGKSHKSYWNEKYLLGGGYLIRVELRFK